MNNLIVRREAIQVVRTVATKSDAREKIQRETSEYLAKGGEIAILAPPSSARVFEKVSFNNNYSLYAV